MICWFGVFKCLIMLVIVVFLRVVWMKVCCCFMRVCVCCFMLMFIDIVFCVILILFLFFWKLSVIVIFGCMFRRWLFWLSVMMMLRVLRMVFIFLVRYSLRKG